MRRRADDGNGPPPLSARGDRANAPMGDPYALARFVAALNGIYETALGELRRGAKRSHWMWFVFPQMAGLSPSPMAERYGIHSLEEAKAYLEHALLGPRYCQCVATLQDLGGTTIEAVFGPVDALKLRSSLTLFEEASGEPLFAAAIDRWLHGRRDQRTLDLLARARGSPGRPAHRA